MILITTFEEDPQGNQLVAELNQMGFRDFLRLDMGRSFERNKIHLELSDKQWNWEISFLEAPDLSISSENLHTAFHRRPLHSSLHRKIFYPAPGETDISQTFSAVNWILNMLDARVFPFGHPINLLTAENKFLQLATAASIGLVTSPTHFSTQPDLLGSFALASGSVVVKSLGSQSTFNTLPDGEDQMNIFGASIIDGETLNSQLANYQNTQLYLQKAVPKVAEHRIIAIPGDFIDCRIDTSILPDNEVDYRPHIAELPHKIVDLPHGLAPLLHKFLEKMNLTAGCFDFAELADGTYVFFECNPAGEWLWIERLTHHPITKLMAECLVLHHQQNFSPSPTEMPLMPSSLC